MGPDIVFMFMMAIKCRAWPLLRNQLAAISDSVGILAPLSLMFFLSC